MSKLCKRKVCCHNWYQLLFQDSVYKWTLFPGVWQASESSSPEEDFIASKVIPSIEKGIADSQIAMRSLTLSNSNQWRLSVSPVVSHMENECATLSLPAEQEDNDSAHELFL